MQIDGAKITIDKGDTDNLVFRFYNKRAPVDLTGKTFRFIIKTAKEALDNTAIMDDTYQAPEADKNYITIPINTTVTDNPATSYFWGLRMITDGQVTTLKEGIFIIRQGTFYGAEPEEE